VEHCEQDQQLIAVDMSSEAGLSTRRLRGEQLPFQSSIPGQSYGEGEERGQAWEDSDSDPEAEPPLQKRRRIPSDRSMEHKKKGKESLEEESLVPERYFFERESEVVAMNDEDGK
jgi:hypothetical protein